MPPNNVPVSVLAQEAGISDVTLYHWLKQARSGGMEVPGDGGIQGRWLISRTASALTLEVAVWQRIRHVSATNSGARKYMNMRLLEEMDKETAHSAV